MKHKLKKTKIFLLAYLLFCCLFTSACFVNDNLENVSDVYNIDFFQVLYKNDTNEQGILLENFVADVWQEVCAEINADDLVENSDTTTILQIVCYELALNKTVTPYYILNNNINLISLLSQNKEEYRLNSEYIGLSEESKNYFINYIVENLTINNANRTKNIEIIENIVNENYEGKLNLCLNSTISSGDNTSPNTFLVSNSSGFTSIQAKKYQSIIISPSKNGVFNTLIFGLECQKDVSIKVEISYYNLTNNYKEFASQTFNLNNDTSASSTMTTFNTKQSCTVSSINKNYDGQIFNVNKTINNDTSNSSHSLAEYYPIKLNNDTDFTSINTTLLTSDFCESGFFEITFIPSKSVDFKFGIYAFFVD